MTDRAVLSVDLELFTQTPAYRSASGETTGSGIGLDGVEHLLAALEARDAESTFFVVSSTAEEHPAIVQSIAEAGHEVASHTHTHRLLATLDDPDRRDELARSRRVLERIAGTTVSGFRAPAFDRHPDHFDDLADAGYRYDSSVVPSRRIPGWYGSGVDVHRPAPASRIQPGAPDGLLELPVSVFPRLRLPLTGAWLRFFGTRYAAEGMRRLARRGITPVLYVHPWELVDLPPVDGVPARVYWRTGEWMRRAVGRILDQPFEFVTAESVVEEAGDAGSGRPAPRDVVATGGRGVGRGAPRGGDDGSPGDG